MWATTPAFGSTRLVVDGAVTGSWHDDTSGSSSIYAQYTLNFTANGTSHRIGIDVADTGSLGTISTNIDDVLVVA